MSFASLAFAQASSKGSAKAVDKDAAPGDEPDSAQPQDFDAKMLIGDAVDDADSPQYRKVTAAIDKFRERRVKDARDLLREARATQPKLPPPEVLIAKLFIVARQPQLAMGELEQAVTNHSEDPEAYLILADGSLSEQRVTAAEALYQQASEKVKAFNENPKRKENFEKRVLNGLAAVAESRQQWASAETLLRQLIKLDAKNAAAQQRLGRVLFQQATPRNNKRKESYDAFIAAVQADPKAIKPDIAMGQLFEQAAQQALAANDKGKFEEYRGQAKTFFDRATRAQVADLNSLLAASVWALQTNDLRLAQQYSDAAIKLDNDSIEARLVRALVARFSGDLPTAEKLLNEAFNDSPGNFALSNQLALVLVDSRDKDKQNRALQLAQMNYRQYQNNAEAASTLGWVLYRMGHKSEAGQALQAVLNARQVSPDSAFYVATILADQGRNAEAIELLQLALANPQPFANRLNAANLQADLRKKGDSQDSTDSKDDAKTPTSTTSGNRDSGAAKSSSKSKSK